jgi:hypothetical protein
VLLRVTIARAGHRPPRDRAHPHHCAGSTSPFDAVVEVRAAASWRSRAWLEERKSRWSLGAAIIGTGVAAPGNLERGEVVGEKKREVSPRTWSAERSWERRNARCHRVKQKDAREKVGKSR